MEILKKKYTITELSERLSITDHALRYYEKEFHFTVPKDERGRRYYTPELANLMFQVKTMRDEGLEIKAIRKILQPENASAEPPPVVPEDVSESLVPQDIQNNTIDIRQFFDEFKEQLTSSVSLEVNSAREHITREIGKSKLELGACFENSVRRLETKLEKHFTEVDRSLGSWREKNRQGVIKNLLGKVFK